MGAFQPDTSVKTVSVREIMKFSPLEVFKGLNCGYNVRFENSIDNQMPAIQYMTAHEIKISRYVWEVCTLLEDMKIISRYAIGNFYCREGYFTGKSINEAFTVILSDIIEQYAKPTRNRSVLRAVFKKMWQLNNDIYNDIGCNTARYIVSINILDFLEIQFQPELIAAITEANKKRSVDAIGKSYAALDTVMQKPELANNTLAIFYNTNVVNPQQVKQLLACRGFIIDINSAVFKRPITSSFVLGMPDIYSMVVETRTAARALKLSGTAIQETEYSARTFQMIAMPLPRISDGDCKTTKYMDWYVRSAKTSTSGKSDLPNLVGLFYLNDAGEEETITSRHTHLEGRVIKLRTPLSCQHYDSGSVCVACLGDMAYSTHKHTHIGYTANTVVSGTISQLTLSTKHLTFSAVGADILLSKEAQLFFTVVDKTGIAFKPGILDNAHGTKYHFVISQNALFGFGDVVKNIEIEALEITRMSNIPNIFLVEQKANGSITHYPITINNTSSANNNGAFTHQFLKYILNGNKWRLNKYDNYIIDVSDYRGDAPIFRMPQVEINYLDISRAIKGLLKSKKGKQSMSPEILLQELFDIVNAKLNINIVNLAIIVVGFTIYNRSTNDLRPGRGSPNPGVGSIAELLRTGSIGGVFAFERILEAMLDPRRITIEGMPASNPRQEIASPMDIYVSPDAVVRELHSFRKEGKISNYEK